MAGSIVDPEAGPRSKRAAILAAAVGCFGEFGYEATKWSTVADRVGIGQTALYHYDIETAWTGLLARGMAAGVFPERDPHTLAQAVLGLLVSVWRWYRWGGRLELAEVRDFYLGCVRRMVETG